MKIYLKKIKYDVKKNSKLKDIKREFVDFTQAVWIEETTNENIGNLLDTEWKKVLKLNALYWQVKNKYDLLYKNSNIEKTVQTNTLIVVILIVLVIMNIISIAKLF